jgi:hypothetical protein
MDVHHVTTGPRRISATRPATDLSGQWLLLARVSWCVIALLSLVFFLWGLPERFEELTLFWFTTDPAPPEIVREGVDHLGLTPGLFAGYGLTLYIGRATAFYLVSVLLFWRKPNDRLAFFVALFLVALPSGDNDPLVLHDMAVAEPVRAAIGKLVELVGFTLALWLLFLFPDGRFRPRWSRVVAMAWLLAGIGALLLPGTPLDMLSWSLLLSAAFIPICAALAIAAQGWRYRHISSPVERQQTKWFALGLTIVLIEFSIGNVLTSYAPLAWPAASPTQVVLTDLILYTIHSLAFLTIPLSLAVAVLRYRLWDIDVLINRALVYGGLSATLVGVYLGSVVLVEALVRAASGQGSNLAIAVSTLATAGLIQPLRRRIQATVDRRFYRRKYDATRTVAAFGAALRDETDLGRIQTSLLAIVEETMQPAHVSLWLRQPPIGRDG